MLFKTTLHLGAKGQYYSPVDHVLVDHVLYVCDRLGTGFFWGAGECGYFFVYFVYFVKCAAIDLWGPAFFFDSGKLVKTSRRCINNVQHYLELVDRFLGTGFFFNSGKLVNTSRSCIDG